jgi:hypothetical protein
VSKRVSRLVDEEMGEAQTYVVYAPLNATDFRVFESLCRRRRRTTSSVAGQALREWLKAHARHGWSVDSIGSDPEKGAQDASGC